MTVMISRRITRAVAFVVFFVALLCDAQFASAQFEQSGPKLVGTGNAGVAFQGFSVALSGDGNTAIVGGLNDNAGVGAAWVFTHSSDAWIQQGAKLVGTAGSSPTEQGFSVALSFDGSTALVGGLNGDTDAGAAWVFIRSGSRWTQQGAKLVGSGAAGLRTQGYAVALSADGNTALVGGQPDNSGNGAAWVFTRRGGMWIQQGPKLVGSGAVGAAGQGIAVALSADGNTALVGGYGDNAAIGAAWVFARSKDGVWTQQGPKLVGADHAGKGLQGYAVALSADGNTALVGGSGDNAGNGAAWVFVRSNGVWKQQGPKLVGIRAAGAALQGRAVALSGDGNTALVGGFADNAGTGATWVFTRSGGVWTQQGSKLVGTGSVGDARQGISVALSASGRIAIVGGWNDNSRAGASWIFARPLHSGGGMQ